MPQSSEDTLRRDAMECPHCGQVTQPNLLADGSMVCSCPAERGLSPELGCLAAPLDEAPPPDADRRGLESGPFGRDVATEDYLPLRDPPGGWRQGQ